MSTDDTISRTIRALTAYRGIPASAMAEKLGMSRGGYYSRLSGETRWTAAEVAEVAQILDVPVADLYRGIAA